MRKRTAKQLGTRHDRNYFKAWTRQKRWLAALALILPALFLGWLGVQAVRGQNAPYSSGQMSRAHAVLSKQCSACHANFVANVRVGGFRKHAQDAACLTCHEAPMHHADQKFTPTCGSCHTEHIGAVQLARTSDQSCTQCHSDLQSTSGNPHFERSVLSFTNKHPEFAAVKASDPGKVAFNHAVHMKAGLMGPPGKNQRMDLECSDCHRSTAEADGPWRFGSPKWQQASAQVPSRNADRSYMAPIAFDKHCVACHTMPFDSQVNASAPHEKPAVVHEFVLAALKDYIAKNPTAWRASAEPLRRVPGVQPVSLATARNSDEWLKQHLANDESLLWGKTCRQCHQFSSAVDPSQLPQVVPSNLTAKWFKHAYFDHSAHAAVRCDSCHEKALTSERTSDVLVPGIETCRSCHSGKSTASAESGCFECHQYHDWKQRKPFKPVYSIPQLTGQD